MENITDTVKTVTFESDQKQTGTAEEWTGGYDENGDYTGDGEFFDAVTQDLYPVIAWKKLPGVPDSYVEKSLVNQETEIIENKSEETGKEEYFSDKEYEKKQLFDVSVMIGCLIIRWITKYYSVSLICDCFMVIVLIDFLTNKNIYQQRKKRK